MFIIFISIKDNKLFVVFQVRNEDIDMSYVTLLIYRIYFTGTILVGFQRASYKSKRL